MDLLAQKRVLLVLILWCMTARVQAAEGVFHLSMVDYFDMKIGQEDRFSSSPDTPKAVAEFLDDPSEKTALGYLRWHRQRLLKIARAQEILDRVSASFSWEDRE